MNDSQDPNEVPIPPRQPDQSDESGTADSGTNSQESQSDSSPSDAARALEAAGGEQLPEWEPLTPELVEDEAIRADFMLRWAVILLAFLFGCSEIISTRTLVHIRSGEYLAGNGFLPPGVDVFSYTAGDTPWIQLSWLFDLGVAGIFQLAGGWGLTFAKALIAALALATTLRIARPGVSTWWNCITGAILVVACYHHWTANPESVTLLGTALTVYLLHRWTEGDPSVRWKLPLCQLIWANLDPFAFVGPMLVVLFVVGFLIDQRSGRGTSHEGAADWRLVIGLSLIACMANPFLWQSLSWPIKQFGQIYPALQFYNPLSEAVQPRPQTLLLYPLLDPLLMKWLDVPLVCGMVLGGLAVFSLAVNYRRLSFAHAFLLAGGVFLALLASHELAIGAVIATAVTNLNIQQWYQSTFRQTYSTNRSELLFSRGGRAITVLCLFGLAFLVISGRFALPKERRIGLGFDEQLADIMVQLPQELSDELDDRPFNFRPDQGDLLIWAGQKVFIDNRMDLFTSGEPTILSSHDDTRRALRKASEDLVGSGKPEVWKTVLAQYDVTHVVPRMYSPNPDYRTYGDLLFSPEAWQLTRLDASSASFYRRDLPDSPELQEYLKSHAKNWVNDAFRGETPPFAERLDWARPAGFYDRYLTMPEPQWSSNLQRATHFFRMLSTTPPNIIDLRVAYAHLAIREANLALALNPQDAEALRILGVVYTDLGVIEANLTPMPRDQSENLMLSPLRYLQASMALNQSLVIERDRIEAHLVLFNVYQRMNRIDLQHRELTEILRLQVIPDSLTPEQADALSQDNAVLETLRQRVEEVEKQVRQELEKSGEEPSPETLIPLISAASQLGCPQLALDIFDEHLEVLNQVPPAILTRANLLLECGEIEVAFEELAKLEGLAEENEMISWYFLAAMSSLGNGDYARATKLLYDDLRLRQRQLDVGYKQSLLATFPLASNPSRFLWPLRQIQGTQDAVTMLPTELEGVRLQIIASHLEAGQSREATEMIRTMLKEAPESAYRQTLRVYLAVTTGDLIDSEVPINWFEENSDNLLPGSDSSTNDADEPPVP